MPWLSHGAAGYCAEGWHFSAFHYSLCYCLSSATRRREGKEGEDEGKKEGDAPLSPMCKSIEPAIHYLGVR